MNIIDREPLTQTPRLGIVISRFNENITDRLYASITQGLYAEKLEAAATLVWVPGAIEIPLVAKKMAASGKFDAIITLGAVIRGETSHYDFVCQQVNEGCLQVMMQYDIPVIFGVLTTDNEQQALARSGGVHGDKALDCLQAAMHMISVCTESF